jgi:integrase
MIPYKYAQLCKGLRWYISYSVENPFTKKLERKRIYISHIKNENNRLRYALRLINEINSRLDKGWNPLISNEGESKFIFLSEAFEKLLEYKRAYLRKRSMPNYESRVRVLTDWIAMQKLSGIYAFQFSAKHANELMTYLLVKRKFKAVTYNNYLSDFRSIFTWFQKQSFTDSNPFEGINYLPEEKKIRQTFTPEELTRYVDYLKNYDYDFYIISCYCYYCAVRPNEIVQLKIKNIDLEKGIIEIPAEISKNKRQRKIPIAKLFLNELKSYLPGKDKDYYLCSKQNNMLLPGKKKIAPTRIAEHFKIIAKHLELPDNVKFYSLKDTCADRLIESGFSAKTIRDLFGHSSIAITNEYLQSRNAIVDTRLVNEFPELS